MPQSALTPADICSSFCLSRSMGLGAGGAWAKAGRTNNKITTALIDLTLIIFHHKGHKGSLRWRILQPLCSFVSFVVKRFLKSLPPDQAHRIGHASAAAWAAILVFHFVALSRCQKQVFF